MIRIRCNTESCKNLKPSFGHHGNYSVQYSKSSKPRYICKHCGVTYSEATNSEMKYQKKPHLIDLIGQDYAKQIGINELARKYKVHKATVYNKIKLYALKAHNKNQETLETYRGFTDVQLDELETFEHTKLKPVHVALAVEKGSRRILGFDVSQAPYDGRFAPLALKKYGPREDQRREGVRNVLANISPYVSETACIDSDRCPFYPKIIREVLPDATHVQYDGKKPKNYGLGELKQVAFDPLFSINHTFAMLRAHLNRLFRKTWCTTKKLEYLTMHLEIYIAHHNQRIEELERKKQLKLEKTAV